MRFPWSRHKGATDETSAIELSEAWGQVFDDPAFAQRLDRFIEQQFPSTRADIICPSCGAGVAEKPAFCRQCHEPRGYARKQLAKESGGSPQRYNELFQLRVSQMLSAGPENASYLKWTFKAHDRHRAQKGQF